MRPIRLTAVLTHPVQYYSPWFRHVATHAPDIDLTVLYATEPTAEQQGAGFGKAFQWDVPLRDGYRSQVMRSARGRDRVNSESFLGVDAREIGAALRAACPDVVLIPGWHSITFVRAILAARRLEIPLLFRGDTNLDSAPAGWKRPLWRWKTRYLLSLFDGYLSPGRRARAYLESMGVDSWRIADTPHCVDNERFASVARPHQSAEGRVAARARWGFLADDWVVLFAGKLEAKKRPLDVIRAAARLEPRAAVLIVGAGSLESACRAEALRLGVRTTFGGFLNQSELGAAYGAADLLVLPSDSRETWGLVVNEALATGRPAVVSDRVGCAPDLVDDETGATFPCGDVEALAAAIQLVRRRASTRSYGDACRARAADFGVEAATRGLVRACHLVARVPASTPGSSPAVETC
jgi:glycosyltransferase involved in cell wall biosynthesis